MATKITRLNRESNPPPGVLASPVPQYYDQETEQVEDVEGRKGAPLSMLVDTDGQPISPATAGGQTTTQNKIDTLATLIGALDASKETDPDAASATLLALLRGLLATIAAIKGNDGIKKIADAVTVDGLNALATESTLGEVKSALAALGATSDAAETDPAETASQIALLKGLLTGLNTVAGTVDNGAAKVTLQGSLPPSMMELAVNDWSELPDPTETPKGATAQLIGTFDVRQNTGTEWVEVVM